MNIQEENSARYFRVQSEREQTLIIIIIIFIIIINFFIRVFSEYTEAPTTSLIPIDAILPEICTFTVGFNCTAWTKMTSLQAN